MLDGDGNPVSQDLGSFFEQWDWAAAGQEMRELREAIARAKHNRKGKPHRQSTVIDEWLTDLRTEMEEGWTGYGQTNYLLKTIACYGVVFEGLSGDALVEFVQTTAINAPGYGQWCRHQQEIRFKAMVWARSAQGYYWRLGTQGNRHQSGYSDAGADLPATPSLNVQRAEDAQQRIQTAVNQLKAEGRLADTATARAKQIAVQGMVSLKTLYRYPHLWHPDHSMGIEQSCKTEPPERDVAIDPGIEETEPRSLKSSDRGKFYTLEKSMKGKASESGSALSPSSQTTRRPSNTNFGGKVTPLPQSHQGFESQRVVQLSFPQLLHSDQDELDLAQIGLTCTEALSRGDRLWVLRRLWQLWRDGHAELVRSLCRTHPDWGLAVGERGLMEVNQDAPQR